MCRLWNGPSMKTYSAHQLIFFGISGVLLLAIFPLPYSFYTAINLFVALTGGLLVFIAYRLEKWLWIVPGAAAIFLYLPAFGQPFDKTTWVTLDVIFIVVFLVAAITLRGRVLEAGSDSDG